MLLPPPIVIVALIAGLAWWLSRSWKVPTIAVACLAFVINQGLWKETVETLALVVGAAIGLHADRGAGGHRGGAQ